MPIFGASAGTYHVTATAPGLKSAVLTGVVAQIQNLSTLSITLQVGTQTESITVDAGAPHVEAESSEMGGIVTEKQVIELPSRWEVLVSSAVKAFKVLVAGNNGAGYGKSQLSRPFKAFKEREWNHASLLMYPTARTALLQAFPGCGGWNSISICT